MCFSENQSYLNAFLLASAGLYKISTPKLSLVGLYFSLKELLQGLLYKYHYKNDKEMKQLLATLSYVHICFQPLFVSILFSHFDSNPKLFNWNIIFIITIIFGIYMTTTIEELDIQNDPNCKQKSPNDDFCKETSAYMGKYHIAYQFNLDNFSIINPWHVWQFLTFIPVLFTKSYPIGLLFLISVFLIYGIYNYINDIPGIPGMGYEFSGEKSAIWCFLTVGFVPFILFEKQIKKLL